MISAFIDSNASDGMYGTVPAIFAKRFNVLNIINFSNVNFSLNKSVKNESSMVLTPVFYIFLNKKIRRAIFGKIFDPTSDVATMTRSKN
jgi:hypothetical protein